MASGAFVGAIFGFTVALYSNAVRKLPVFQAPWEHALYATIGAYAGNKVVQFTDRTAAEVDEKIKERHERNKVLQEPAQ